MNTLSTILLLCSCVIGAGYVSGRELIMLIGGNNTVISSAIFALMYGLLIYGIISYCNGHNITNTIQWAENIGGKYSYIISGLMLLCHLTMNVTMLATINETINAVLTTTSRLPIYAGIVCILVGLFLLKGAKGLSMLCNISMPTILVVLMVAIFTNIDKIYLHSGLPTTIESAKYALFNGVMSLGVIIPIANRHHHDTQHVAIGVALILFLTTTVILALMDHYPYNIHSLPLLSLSNGRVLAVLSCSTLVISATTSVATNSYTLSTWLNNIIDDNISSVGIVMILSLALSLFGLDILLPLMYPAVTAFGVIMLLLCIWSYIRQKSHKNKPCITQSL